MKKKFFFETFALESTSKGYVFGEEEEEEEKKREKIVYCLVCGKTNKYVIRTQQRNENGLC